MTQEPYDDLEKQDAALVDEALQLLMQSNFEAAKQMLKDVISRSPEPQNYVRQFEKEDAIYVKFWDLQSFMAAVAVYQTQNPTKKLIWLSCAYPRAFYYLGFIAVAQGNNADAFAYLDSGARLEPENANFDLEKAQALAGSGQKEAAIEHFEKVLSRGEDVMPAKRAVALRGLAVQYIDLGRLEEAEAFLNRSLEIEPTNKLAQSELHYISELRSGGHRLRSGLIDSLGQDKKCVRCGREGSDGRFGMVEGKSAWMCRECLANQDL